MISARIINRAAAVALPKEFKIPEDGFFHIARKGEFPGVIETEDGKELNVIQVMLPAMLDEAVHRRGMTLAQFARLSATGPCEVIGLRPQKGAIEVGADGDLAIWDLDAQWTVTPDQLFSTHKWTPLTGREIRGRVRTTLRRGEVVYHDGAVLGQPGSGRWLSAPRVAALPS